MNSRNNAGYSTGYASGYYSSQSVQARPSQSGYYSSGSQSYPNQHTGHYGHHGHQQISVSRAQPSFFHQTSYHQRPVVHHTQDLTECCTII